MSIRIGIVGISGFGGGEALRLVAGHPSFDLVYAAGEGSAGSRLADRFPGVPSRLAREIREYGEAIISASTMAVVCSASTSSST